MKKLGSVHKVIGLVFGLMLFFSLFAAASEEPDIATTTDASEAVDVHEKQFRDNFYPSAFECKTCHETQYRQWALSPHSYSQLSPAFTAQHVATIKITNGSAGTFCARCHDPVGAALKVSPSLSNMQREQNTREGVTCIVCHRQNKRYGKGGQLVVQPGDIFAPVSGPEGNKVQKETMKETKLHLTTSADEKGRPIHKDVNKFFTLREPALCGICHSVRLPTGLHTEETYDEYKTSPAARDGVTCSNCHNGKKFGKNKGYEKGPAAIIDSFETSPRRISNHYMGGPDFSVLHPGIFPHNPDAVELASYEQWLQFDYKAGWGTDEFENAVAAGYGFPDYWKDADLRYEARTIINDQLASLEWAKKRREEILKAGYGVQDFVLEKANLDDGLSFKIKLANLIDGHNVPTGFIHERMVFFEITLKDSKDNVVFRSGDRDPNGDLRDPFSLYVRNGKLPPDDQLFNLQSRFKIKSLLGGERTQSHFFPVSIMATPFIRPPINPTSILGHADTQRVEKHTIEPKGHRWATYHVSPDQLKGDGEYRLDMKLIAQPMPGYFLKGISDSGGLDYHFSVRELTDRMVNNSLVLWQKSEIINLTK